MPPCGIRTHNLSRRAAEDLRLRPCGRWDRNIIIVWSTNNLGQKERKLNSEFYVDPVLERLFWRILRMRPQFGHRQPVRFVRHRPWLFCNDSEVLAGESRFCDQVATSFTWPRAGRLQDEDHFKASRWTCPLIIYWLPTWCTNYYLFIKNNILLYVFRASSAHLQEDAVVHVQHMVLSLSVRVLGGLSVQSLSSHSSCVPTGHQELS